jgi:uncharacterized repeat protein (TIGR01451 family)
MRMRRAVGVVAVVVLSLAGVAGIADAGVPFADLVVTKSDAPDPVTPTATLTYIISVTNSSTDSANVTVIDTLPAGTTFLAGPAGCSLPVGGTFSCTGITLAGGANIALTVLVVVDAATPAGTVLINTATATSDLPDPNLVNNTATTTTTVVAPGLAVTKGDAPDPVTPGANLTYTVDITNGGPTAAQTVVFADALPAGTTFVSETQTGGPVFTCTTPPVGGTGTISCTIATLASGASASFTVVVNVDPTTPAGSVITNTATVTTVTTDPDLTDNTATATTNVVAPGGEVGGGGEGEGEGEGVTTGAPLSAPVAIEAAPIFTG